MTNQDILENQANRIYLGIGSNLGNRRNKIEQAKYELSLRWDDPKISIKWPILDLEPFLSKKDKNALFIDKIDKSKLF